MYITKQILNQQSRNKLRAHKNSIFKEMKINQFLTDGNSFKPIKRSSSILTKISQLSGGSNSHSNSPNKISIFKSQKDHTNYKKNSTSLISQQKITSGFLGQQRKYQRNTVNLMITQKSIKQQQQNNIHGSIDSISQQTQQSKQQILNNNANFSNNSNKQNKIAQQQKKIKIQILDYKKIKQQSILQDKLDDIINISIKFSKKKVPPVIAQQDEEQIRNAMFRKTINKCGRGKYAFYIRNTTRQVTTSQRKSPGRKSNIKTHILQQNNRSNSILSPNIQRRKIKLFTQKPEKIHFNKFPQNIIELKKNQTKQYSQSQQGKQNEKQLKQLISQKCIDLQMDQEDQKDRIQFRKYILKSIANIKTLKNLNKSAKSIVSPLDQPSMKQNKFIKTMKRLQETKILSNHEKIQSLKKQLSLKNLKNLKKVTKLDKQFSIVAQAFDQTSQNSLINVKARKNILEQNCYKLQKFIRGGIINDFDDYSDYSSLTYLNQTKENFKIFDELYKSVKTNSNFSQLNFDQLSKPDIQSMVFINQKINDITKSKQMQIYKKLKIVK